MQNDLIVYFFSYLLPVVVVLSIGAPEIQLTPRFKILGNPAPGRARRVFFELTAMNLAILIFFTWAIVAPPLWITILVELGYGIFSRYAGPYLD